MKKKIVLIAIIFASVFANSSWAQVSFQINLGSQPLWGPTGYDVAQYYYIPDIDAYYDVNNRDYVYFDDGRWVTSVDLPSRYSDIDLYRAHKVVINSRDPWLRHNYYHDHYSMYRGRHDQRVIRDAREQKYWANPEHPRHGNWHGNDYNRGYERHHEWNGYRPNDRSRYHHDNGNRHNDDNQRDNDRRHGEGHDRRDR